MSRKEEPIGKGPFNVQAFLQWLSEHCDDRPAILHRLTQTVLDADAKFTAMEDVSGCILRTLIDHCHELVNPYMSVLARFVLVNQPIPTKKQHQHPVSLESTPIRTPSRPKRRLIFSSDTESESQNASDDDNRPLSEIKKRIKDKPETKPVADTIRSAPYSKRRGKKPAAAESSTESESMLDSDFSSSGKEDEVTYDSDCTIDCTGKPTTFKPEEVLTREQLVRVHREKPFVLLEWFYDGDKRNKNVGIARCLEYGFPSEEVGSAPGANEHPGEGAGGNGREPVSKNKRLRIDRYGMHVGDGFCVDSEEEEEETVDKTYRCKIAIEWFDFACNVFPENKLPKSVNPLDVVELFPKQKQWVEVDSILSIVEVDALRNAALVSSSHFKPKARYNYKTVGTSRRFTMVGVFNSTTKSFEVFQSDAVRAWFNTSLSYGVRPLVVAHAKTVYKGALALVESKAPFMKEEKWKAREEMSNINELAMLNTTLQAIESSLNGTAWRKEIDYQLSEHDCGDVSSFTDDMIKLGWTEVGKHEGDCWICNRKRLLSFGGSMHWKVQHFFTEVEMDRRANDGMGVVCAMKVFSYVSILGSFRKLYEAVKDNLPAKTCADLAIEVAERLLKAHEAFTKSKNIMNDYMDSKK
jgi:hypothetical protein